jgi:nucleoside phosphorylase
MVAVTFALPAESRDFRRMLQNREEEVAILHTGVGERACRERLGSFLDSHKFQHLISCGFAGGIDPALLVGDLLFAENFCDPRLLAGARALIDGHVGKLVTADAIIESAADRQQFAQQNGAAAVDMETEFIARECAVRQLPMLSLRAISDTAAAPFPAPPSVLFDLERQKTDPWPIAIYLLRHPTGVVRLMRFARQVANARAKLAIALDALLGGG